MDFAEKMLQMRELEDEIRHMAEGITDDLVIAVANQPFTGSILSDGRNGKPAICTIRFSDLSAWRNLTPEYYMPTKQAEAVRKRLSSCKTVGNFIVAVKDMLKDKRVKTGSSSNDYVYLNENTLSIIHQSEIGRFIVNNENGNYDENYLL